MSHKEDGAVVRGMSGISTCLSLGGRCQGPVCVGRVFCVFRGTFAAHGWRSATKCMGRARARRVYEQMHDKGTVCRTHLCSVGDCNRTQGHHEIDGMVEKKSDQTQQNQEPACHAGADRSVAPNTQRPPWHSPTRRADPRPC